MVTVITHSKTTRKLRKKTKGQITSKWPTISFKHLWNYYNKTGKRVPSFSLKSNCWDSSLWQLNLNLSSHTSAFDARKITVNNFDDDTFVKWLNIVFKNIFKRFGKLLRLARTVFKFSYACLHFYQNNKKAATSPHAIFSHPILSSLVWFLHAAPLALVSPHTP